MFWLFAGLFILTGSIVGPLAMANTNAMVDEINRSPKRETSFGALWWYPGKYQAVKAEHRRLFPDSDRWKRTNRYNAIIAAVFIIAFIGIVATRG